MKNTDNKIRPFPGNVWAWKTWSKWTCTIPQCVKWSIRNRLPIRKCRVLVRDRNVSVGEWIKRSKWRSKRKQKRLIWWKKPGVSGLGSPCILWQLISKVTQTSFLPRPLIRARLDVYLSGLYRQCPRLDSGNWGKWDQSSESRTKISDCNSFLLNYLRGWKPLWERVCR